MRFSLQIILYLSITYSVLLLSCKSEVNQFGGHNSNQETVDIVKEDVAKVNSSNSNETTWEGDIGELGDTLVEKTIAEENEITIIKSEKETSKVIEKKKPIKKKTQPKKKYSKIVFEEMEYDFGKIVEGDTITHKFVFKNDSKIPLEIISTHATCGCTRPSFPFIPIEPGEEGYIGVEYISINKEGYQKPEITVKSNGSSKPILLYLTGYVEPKPEVENPVKLDSLTPVKLSKKG